MRNAFASIVQARPCPTFGRPVRPGVAPSTTARYFSAYPSDSASRRTPCPPKHVERRLQVGLGCVRLSPSCPNRRLHTFLSLRPARHYPRLWIRRSSSERRRDFNPPDLGAAQRTLRSRPTPHIFPDGFVSSTSRRGPGHSVQPGEMRSPRFRRVPFVRDGVSDLGRAPAPRISVPSVLPSTLSTVSASATLCLSRLNVPPHTIAVYASPRSSPSAAQHSLPGGCYPLPGPDFHRLERASFAWRLVQRFHGATRITLPHRSGRSRCG